MSNVSGKNIAYYRRLKGITQKKLAEMVGVSTSFMSQVENGISNPSWENITKFAKALGVEPQDIATFSDEKIDPIKELVITLIKLTENDTIEWSKKYSTLKGVNSKTERNITVYTSFIDRVEYKIHFDIIEIILYIMEYGNYVEIANSNNYAKELSSLVNAVNISIDDKSYIYDNLRKLKDLLKED